MKAQTIEVQESAGRVLCCSIFRPSGEKVLAKGHLLSYEDVRLLSTEGMDHVWVTELEDGEIGEDEAVTVVGQEMGCGCLEVRLAPGGRSNLVATQNCCVLVDDELLKQINCTASTVISTVANFSYVTSGQRVATVKSAPFAVAASQLEAIRSILKERGPILQARPVQNPVIGVIYTDPLNGERARQLFENTMTQRLSRFGVAVNYSLSSIEEEGDLVRSIQHMLLVRPTVILVASTTAPAGPEDEVGRAMQRVGFRIERFLAPVEPGNLLLLAYNAYNNDVPIVSAPGCFRSAKPNVVDLILPPVLAKYRISGWEIASLGHGGLLA